MNADEFARAAYPLLAEGIVLLRAHAGEGPAIERYVATVEKVRAQYRAAKEAPAPAPDVAPPGFRIVGRSGPGILCIGSVVKVRNRDGSRVSERSRVMPAFSTLLVDDWNAGCYDLLDPIQPSSNACELPAPAPEPSAPPAGVPVCKAPGWCGGRIHPGAGGVNGGPVWRSESRGLEFCSESCLDRTLNPPPSDTVTVATGGVPVVAQPSMSPEAGEPTAGVSNSESSDAGRQAVPLSQAMLTDLSPVEASERVAALEAELAEAKKLIEFGRIIAAENLAGHDRRQDERDAARAEVEQLRGKLADAIKAAVDKANNRAANAFLVYRGHMARDAFFSLMSEGEFVAWLRSGEDAPGAVGK